MGGWVSTQPAPLRVSSEIHPPPQSDRPPRREIPIATRTGFSAFTPFLRGIAVDARGMWVAASGCGSVLRIAPDGKITTALKAEKPWVPAGVFVRTGDLYVLEHIDGNSLQHEDWPPRVRKLARDGRITTLCDLSSPSRR